MNCITEITKRDILDLFQNGLEIDEFFQTRTVTYNYYGRLEEIDFLKRLYASSVSKYLLTSLSTLA